MRMRGFIKGFTVVPRTRVFPGFLALSLRGKKGNYHRRILSANVIERSFGVKLQEQDAALPDATAGYSRGLDPFIYLNIYTTESIE